MTANHQIVHVCQRCCNPLRLNRDFEKLQRDKLLALVDAQRPDHEETRPPPTIVPVRNIGANYPRYVVPPNPNAALTEAEALATLENYTEPSSSLDHRQKVSASLFDILSGRTEVDHPLCQECADVLLAAKQKCLEYQEEEFNCLRSYLNYLDARADAKLKSRQQRHRRQNSQRRPSQSPNEEKDAGSPNLVHSVHHQLSEGSEPTRTDSTATQDSTEAQNWLSCLSLSVHPDECQRSINLAPDPFDEPFSEDDDDNEDEEELENEDDDEGDNDTDAVAGDAKKVPEDTNQPTTENEVLPANMVPTSEGETVQSSSKHLTKVAKAPTRLSQLRNTVSELQQTLNELLVEGKHLDEQLALANADLERRTEELNKAQTQYNEDKQALLDSEEELLSLEARVTDAEHHLQRLVRTNVLNITFPIWYDGHIGVINGLHLGRLSNRPIPWEEINAAWGQCAMLLQCIARKLQIQFSHYEIVPMGIRSKIIEIKNRRERPLYYVTDIFTDSKFNTGMVMFLNCVDQIQQVIESSSNAQLPYRIKEGGKIYDPQDERTYAITWSATSEEDWTKALKMMLINLKWSIARLATIDM